MCLCGGAVTQDLIHIPAAPHRLRQDRPVWRLFSLSLCLFSPILLLSDVSFSSASEANTHSLSLYPLSLHTHSAHHAISIGPPFLFASSPSLRPSLCAQRERERESWSLVWVRSTPKEERERQEKGERHLALHFVAVVRGPDAPPLSLLALCESERQRQRLCPTHFLGVAH